MAKIEEFLCPNCRTRASAQRQSTFLGFKKFLCPNCGKSVSLDLRTGYRVLYWIVLPLFTLLTISLLLQGKIAIPGILVVAAIIAIVKDLCVRSEMKKLQAQCASPAAGAAPFAPPSNGQQ
ncbi:MAG: hypothetical protein LLG01_18485 [Planctomycetaceae bacterium]|nr:hypothetical protein [Planctomycetaceae bacterium]